MVPCGRNFALFRPHPFTSWTTAISWRSQNTMGPDWGTLVPLGPSHTPAPYGSLHVRKRSLRWQNLPSAAGIVLVACWRQPVGACTGRGRLIQPPAGLCVGAAGNLAFLAVALHRKAGEALAPLAPTISGVSHGGQSLGATSFLWPHVLPAGMHAGDKKVVRLPAGMAFKYFPSRLALMKISTFSFFNRRSGAHRRL